jgi:hypothetical protein
MVERKQAGTFDEFVGKVVDVSREKNEFGDNDNDQYHITMQPTDREIKGSTGLMHEWIRLSAKASEESIPEGSVMDKYLTQVELLMPAAKKEKSILGALSVLKGKTFVFRKVKLGRSYEGHEAKGYWVPVILK